MNATLDTITLPSDKGLEGQVLFSLQSFPGQVEVAINIITASDFYFPENACIFRAIADLYRDKKHIDFYSVRNRIIENGDDATIYQRFAQALESYPFPHLPKVDYLCRYLKELSVKRQAILIGNDLVMSGSDDSLSVEEVIAKFKERTERLSADLSSVNTETISAASLTAKLLQGLEQLKQGHSQAVSTGFHELDKALNGGFYEGQVILVGGKSGLGKTAWAVQVARNVLPDNVVQFITLEVPAERLHQRLLSCKFHRIGDRDGIEHNWWRQTSLPDAYYEMLVESVYLGETLPIYYVEKKDLIHQIFDEIRRCAVEHKTRVVILDYFQRIEVPESKSKTYAQSLAAASRQLCQLALEFGLTIVIISQYNSGIWKATKNDSKMQFHADTSGLVKDAHVVIDLSLMSEHMKDNRKALSLKLKIEKGRDVQTGTQIVYEYVGSKMSIRELWLYVEPEEEPKKEKYPF